MTTRLSRPKRWRTAVARAKYAATALDKLQSEWNLKLQELYEETASLREKKTTRRAELTSALKTLIDLQSEYEDWSSSILDEFSDSPTKEKLDAVADFDFKGVLEDFSDRKLLALEEALDEVIGVIENDYNEEDLLEDVFTTLEGAAECDLPLGYGRD